MKPYNKKDIIGEVAKRMQMDEDFVLEVVNAYYKYLRSCMSDLVYPRILVSGLGTFEIKRKPLLKYIEKYRNISKKYPDAEYAKVELEKYERSLEEIDRLRAIRKSLISLKYANRNTEKLREDS